QPASSSEARPNAMHERSTGQAKDQQQRSPSLGDDAIGRRGDEAMRRRGDDATGDEAKGDSPRRSAVAPSLLPPFRVIALSHHRLIASSPGLRPAEPTYRQKRRNIGVGASAPFNQTSAHSLLRSFCRNSFSFKSESSSSWRGVCQSPARLEGEAVI